MYNYAKTFKILAGKKKKKYLVKAMNIAIIFYY